MARLRTTTDATSRRPRAAARRGVARLVAAAVALASVPAAAAQTLLLTDDLALEPVRVDGLRDGVLTVRAAGGEATRTVDLAEVLALVIDDGERPPIRPRSLLALAGGQRLPGYPAADSEEAADRLQWRHPWLGRVSVPIERVREIRLEAADDLPAGDRVPLDVDEAADRVVLVNGDVLSGFLLALGGEVEVETSVAGGPPRVSSVPIDRVARVVVRSETPPRAGARAWFREGTVIDVDSVLMDEGGTVVLGVPLDRADAKPIAVDLNDLAGLAFARERWLALGDLEPAEVSGPPTRWRVPEPVERRPQAALGLGAIELWGPMEVRWTMPETGMRFATELELPADARPWADLECVVLSGGEEVFRTALDDARPRASVRVELPGADLTVRIEEAGHGPIQDRVLLRQPRLVRPGG